MVRVFYHIKILPDAHDDFVKAWAQIAAAHREEGKGAVESMLLQDPDDELCFVAISRWETKEAWEEHRRDDAHPKAYATFRQVAQVTQRRVFDELAISI